MPCRTTKAFAGQVSQISPKNRNFVDVFFPPSVNREKTQKSSNFYRPGQRYWTNVIRTRTTWSSNNLYSSQINLNEMFLTISYLFISKSWPPLSTLAREKNREHKTRNFAYQTHLSVKRAIPNFHQRKIPQLAPDSFPLPSVDFVYSTLKSNVKHSIHHVKKMFFRS